MDNYLTDMSALSDFIFTNISRAWGVITNNPLLLSGMVLFVISMVVFAFRQIINIYKKNN